MVSIQTTTLPPTTVPVVDPNQTGTPQTGGTSQPTGTGATTGVGVSGTVNQVPGVSTMDVVVTTVVVAAMIEAVLSFMPQMSDDEMDILLAEVTAKMHDLLKDTDKNEIDNKSIGRERQAQERKQKLEEAEKKLQEMIKLEHSGDIGAKIKLAFMILALALMTAMIAIGTAGTGIGLALAIVGAVATALLTVNEVVTQASGLGIAGNIDKAVHPNDPKSWAKADMGFTLAVTAVALIAAAGQGARALASLPSTIKNLEGASDTALTIAKTVTNVVNALTQIGEAGADVATSAINYEAAGKQAANKRDQARAKLLQALIEELDKLIDLAIKRLSANGDRFAKMNETVIDSLRDRSNFLAHMRHTA